MRYSNRFQTKLLKYFLLVVILPLIGIGLISYFISKNSTEQQVLHSQQQIIGLVQHNIKLIFDDVHSISSYVSDNETVQALLVENDPDIIQQADSKIYNFLSSWKQAKQYISFIIVYGENGLMYRYFNDIYREVIPYEELKETPLYISTAALDGTAVWNSSSSTLFPLLNQYDDVMVGRRITNLYDHDDKLGMMFVGINRQAIRDLFQGINISEESKLLLFDNNYNVIVSNKTDRQLLDHIGNDLALRKQIVSANESLIITILDKQYILSTDEVTAYDWYITSLTPLDKIHEQSRIFVKITLITAFALLVIVALLSAYLSSRVTSPIKNLLRSMSNFKRGDFNQFVPVQSNDEIGLLTKKYNEMVSELNELIQKVYVSQTNQKIIELRNLQAQIEPHFLYNTLDYIFLNSKINGDEQTANVVYSLSELFRLSLNRGEDFYQLSYEMKQIKAYINIQQARFPHIFRVEYEVDEEILNYYSAKLLLQPIVENAIVHAFSENEEQGLLRICGYSDQEHIIFTIEDNGAGMTLDQVHLILQTKTMLGQKRGYGVRNVNERLIMLFGEKYAIQIQSTLHKGTKVTVKFPIISTEEEWRDRYESYDR